MIMEPWDFEGDPKNARTDRPQPAPAAPTVSALLQELVSALDEKRSASEDPVQTVETAERSFAATDRIWALLEPARRALQSAQPAPIPMILHCPNCGLQHIDAPDDPRGQIKCQKNPQCAEPCGEWCGWTNPPHKSHKCAGCLHIWRPADVPTTGVKEIRTKGKNDSPAPVDFFERMSAVEEAFQLVFRGYGCSRFDYFPKDHDYIVFLRKQLTEAFSLLQAVCRPGSLSWRMRFRREIPARTRLPSDSPIVAQAMDILDGVADSPIGYPGRWTEQQHVLYTDKDADRPEAICDTNGQVVLAMCRHCGKAEADLDAGPCPGRGMA